VDRQQFQSAALRTQKCAATNTVTENGEVLAAFVPEDTEGKQSGHPSL
jgi:hypothetical protein